MFEKSVTIGTIDVGNVQTRGVCECLLHSIADAVSIVLRLYKRKRKICTVVEEIVRPLATASFYGVSSYDDLSVGEAVFHFNLAVPIPASVFDRRSNEL